MFSETEESELEAMHLRGCGWPQIAIRAVELAAARGGTMTAARVKEALVSIEHNYSRLHATTLREHISNLSARVAVLEKELEKGGPLALEVLSLRAEVERVQRLPEQEWAEASAAIASALALHAREDQPAAQRALAALDRAKVYVGRLRAERDEALADNAALLAFVTEQTAVECEDVQDDLCGTCGPCLARTLVSRPHPGIALLEEHRKALGEAQKALESQQAECHTLRRAFLHERHRADTAGAQPEHAFNATWAENLLAEERKALMRARNEGLHEAAALARAAAAHGCNPFAECTCNWKSELDGLEGDIRAMMEPETELDAHLSDVERLNASAVGQVLSAHVDKAGGCANPDPLSGPTCAERGCEGGACRYSTPSAECDMDLMCIACNQRTPHRCTPSPDAGAGWRCSECSALSKAGRYPCSPACTHDEAANPGHPERVKERSEAVKAATDHGGYEAAFIAGEEKGAEAMRAACWEAVQAWIQREGLEAFENDVKAAIEGAKP